MENKHSKKSLIDRIFLPILWFLSILATIALTILITELNSKIELQNNIAQNYKFNQLSNVTVHGYFLNLTLDNYITNEKDTALIEYGSKVIQQLEEISTLSPFKEVRDSANTIQTEYYKKFPMLKGSVKTLEIKTGDLIFRHNNALHSELFRKLSVNERKYSHLGIIEYVSADSILVYHSAANDMTGLGGIEVEPIYSFMPKSDYDVAIYRLKYPQETREQLIDEVKRLISKDVPFDPFFNMSDSTKLYCAEMVAYVVNRVTMETLIKPTGIFRGKPFYTIEDCYRLPQIELVYQKESRKNVTE